MRKDYELIEIEIIDFEEMGIETDGDKIQFSGDPDPEQLPEDPA